MRNLQLLTSLRVSGIPELTQVQAISVDYDTGNIYCLTGTHIHLLDPCLASIVDSICLADEENHLPADDSRLVVGAEHLASQQSLCVALATGDVILWSFSLQQVDSVGSVDAGLRAMQWSPDQEIVGLITGRDTLLLMTREFEPVTETPLNQAGFGEAVFVNVGWGKKETQFHGSAGKSAAKETPKDVSTTLSWDDRCPRLSWRGDGQFFVTSSVCPTSGCRQLRVWSRDGGLQSTCEQTDGLEQPLAWKPSGSCIVTAQQCPNKHSIIFYEKNGLRHGEFTLPMDRVKVCEVLWNLDSSILTVWCEDLPPEGATTDFIPKSYIQLWTVGNYHWYLKQNLHFKTSKENRVVSVLWDLEHAYRLHIVTSGGEYMQYTWSWVTNTSWGESCEDEASVAVIDGDKVLITPMKRMVVPPPMSAYELQLPCAVSQVMFAPPPFTNDLAVVLVDGRIAVYKLKSGDNHLGEGVKASGAGGPGFNVCCDVLRLDHVYSIEELPENTAMYPMALTHFSWIMPHCMLFCGTTVEGQSMLYQVEFTGHKDRRLSVESSVEVEGRVLNMATSPTGETVAIQLIDGSLLKYQSSTGTILPWETPEGEELRFPQPCTQILVSEIGEQDVVLGLTPTYRFYVNNVEVASNCTSFAVHEKFLLLTTLTHTCRCISRRTPVQELSRLSDEKAHPFDESIRRVERGSRIVTVVHSDTKLVLQMPRGNLETIHPRALVLSAVRTALDRLEYHTAFTLMRKHRINLNLIYDHSPQMFLNNVTKFLEQISKVAYINIFLTELQEEDSTVTMYRTEYSSQSGQSTRTDDRPSKVDTVCDVIRAALKVLDENKYLLSILTTYVKKTSPELEEALKLIRVLKGQEQSGEVSGVSAEEALKYLLFLVDVNELYDVALGSYDFDLVLMVAEKSQKDPKEYLPFLASLRQLEDNYQRYTIDRHLKRHTKALQHIANCPDQFNECLSLVNEQKLYREALEIFPRKSQQYKTIADVFGEHLMEKKKYEEAGQVFMKAESWPSALQAFEKCHNWRQALCVAAILDYSAENLHDLSLRLAKSLKSREETSAAAVLFEQYVGDIEESITVLIEGQMWEEALRQMYKYKRTDFIDTTLQPSICERHSQQVATLDSLRTEFERHKCRLRVVREEKERSRIEYMEGEGHADADLFSDASSAAGESVQSSRLTTNSQRSTIMSRSTGRSSRNRRKLERKKWSLKEGSQYEDLALLEALSNIVTVVNNLRGEITPLLKMLVQFWQEKEARELQHKYDEFLKVIEKSLPEIWIREEDSDENAVMGPDATANKIAEAMQSGRQIRSGSEQDSLVKARPLLAVDSKWKLGILET